MSNLDSRPEGVRFMRALREPTSRGLTPEQLVPPMQTLGRGSETKVPSMTNVKNLQLPRGGFNSNGFRYDRATDSMHYSLGRRLGFFGASVASGAMGLATLIGGTALTYLALTTAPVLSLALAGPVAMGLALGAVGAGLLVGARYCFKLAAGKD